MTNRQLHVLMQLVVRERLRATGETRDLHQLREAKETISHVTDREWGELADVLVQSLVARYDGPPREGPPEGL